MLVVMARLQTTVRTDAELLLAARTDPMAFRELYERYADQVHGYMQRRTRDDDAAFDLTAETFARAWPVRAPARGGPPLL